MSFSLRKSLAILLIVLPALAIAKGEQSPIRIIGGGSYGPFTYLAYGPNTLFSDGGFYRNPLLNPRNRGQDVSSQGWGFYAGAEKSFSPLWSLGAVVGYTDYGHAKYSVIVNNTENNDPNYIQRRNIGNIAINLLVTARISSGQFNLFSKLGGAIVKTNAIQSELVNARNTSVFSRINEGKSFNLLPEVIVGVGYDVTQMVSLFGSVDFIFGQSYENSVLESEQTNTSHSQLPVMAASLSMVNIGIEIRLPNS